MTRAHPFAPHRLILVLIVVLLALVALASLKGPEWYQRVYHPLMYEETIAYAAKAQSVDPYLVAAVINVESGYKAAVVSEAGAVGLMQVLPATATELGRMPDGERYTAEDLKKPEVSIWVGTKYLAKLLRRYDGDVASALAAYNAGSRHADRWSDEASGTGAVVTETIDFPVTKRYVADVLAERRAYLRLYPDAFGDTGK